MSSNLQLLSPCATYGKQRAATGSSSAVYQGARLPVFSSFGSARPDRSPFHG